MSLEAIQVLNLSEALASLRYAHQGSFLSEPEDIKSMATNVIYIYIYGAPILDVSRSHTTTQHSR